MVWLGMAVLGADCKEDGMQGLRVRPPSEQQARVAGRTGRKILRNRFRGLQGSRMFVDM